MKKISKIILLLSIYFLPFLIGGMTLNISIGPWLSLVFFASFLALTYFSTPMMILGSLSAAQKEDRRFVELTHEVQQVAFSLRINAPRTYFTAYGSPSIWGFGLRNRSSVLVLHQDLSILLTPEERRSVVTYQLLRFKSRKLKVETFLTALGLWFYFPIHLFFKRKSGILYGAFLLSSSAAVFIVEMLQSLIFSQKVIYKLDQKTINTLGSSSAYISALTKLDNLELQLNFSERFLQVISNVRPVAQKDFLSFFIKFPSSEKRIRLLQAGNKI